MVVRIRTVSHYDVDSTPHPALSPLVVIMSLMWRPYEEVWSISLAANNALLQGIIAARYALSRQFYPSYGYTCIFGLLD